MPDLERSTLADLAEEIRENHELACRSARYAVISAIATGELLIKAKALCPHGAWETWVADHCEISVRIAQKYMRVAKHKAEFANTSEPSFLTIEGVLQRIAKPRS